MRSTTSFSEFSKNAAIPLMPFCFSLKAADTDWKLAVWGLFAQRSGSSSFLRRPRLGRPKTSILDPDDPQLVGEVWKLAVRAYSLLKLLKKNGGARQRFVMLCDAQLVQEHQARAQEGLPQPLPEDHDKEVREVAQIHHPVQSLRNCESTTSTGA